MNVRSCIVLLYVYTNRKRSIFVGPGNPICVRLGSNGTGLDADDLELICVVCCYDANILSILSHVVYGATQIGLPSPYKLQDIKGYKGNLRRT